MFDTIKRLYIATKNKLIVYNAVVIKKWITEKNYEMIVGEPFPSN